MGRIENKTVVITGAGAGLGRVTALVMAREGAKIVAAGRRMNQLSETVEQIRSIGGAAKALYVDVKDGTSVRNMMDCAVAQFGKLDVLVNNAGIQGDSQYDIAHMDESLFDEYIQVDLKGPWLLAHYAAAELVRTRGCIINMASVAAYKGLLGCSHYGPAKAGVRNLTSVIANELGPYGVRCNSISPYVVGFDGIGDADRRRCASGTVLNALVDPESVAYAALFLASDEARSVTGTDILVDAGHVTQTQPSDAAAFFKNNRYDGMMEK